MKFRIFLAALLAVLLAPVPVTSASAMPWNDVKPYAAAYVAEPAIVDPWVHHLTQKQADLPVWGNSHRTMAVQTLAYLQGRARAAGIAGPDNLRYVLLRLDERMKCGRELSGGMYAFEYCAYRHLMVVTPSKLWRSEEPSALLQAVGPYASALYQAAGRHYDRYCVIGILIRASQNNGDLTVEQATSLVASYSGRGDNGAAILGWYYLRCPKAGR